MCTVCVCVLVCVCTVCVCLCVCASVPECALLGGVEGGGALLVEHEDQLGGVMPVCYQLREHMARGEPAGEDADGVFGEQLGGDEGREGVG